MARRVLEDLAGARRSSCASSSPFAGSERSDVGSPWMGESEKEYETKYKADLARWRERARRAEAELRLLNAAYTGIFAENDVGMLEKQGEGYRR